MHLQVAAPIREVTQTLADLNLIPAAAVKQLEDRMADPTPEIPRNLPEGAPMPGQSRTQTQTQRREENVTRGPLP